MWPSDQCRTSCWQAKNWSRGRLHWLAIPVPFARPTSSDLSFAGVALNIAHGILGVFEPSVLNLWQNVVFFDSDVFDNVGSGGINLRADLLRIRQGHVSALLRESLESSDSGLKKSIDGAPPSPTNDEFGHSSLAAFFLNAILRHLHASGSISKRKFLKIFWQMRCPTLACSNLRLLNNTYMLQMYQWRPWTSAIHCHSRRPRSCWTANSAWTFCPLYHWSDVMRKILKQLLERTRRM